MFALLLAAMLHHQTPQTIHACQTYHCRPIYHACNPHCRRWHHTPAPCRGVPTIPDPVMHPLHTIRPPIVLCPF
jgi:hypothetical protein